MNTITIRSDEDLAAALRDIARGGDAEEATRTGAQLDATRAIVDAVRERGDVAVAEYTERFDGVRLEPAQFEVPAEDVADGARLCDPDLFDALRRAHDNITRFHELHLRASWREEDADGVVLGQRILPLDSAGVYVPGGKAFYVSSVLMNIVPARVAGVREIVMVSPPSYNGTIHPLILAAASIAGATRVFRIGGAQSVAALAYGTEHVPAVNKITGPGNIYVTLAKRLVAGVCDIDKEAGPSEVVVLADKQSDPVLVAAELMAQAEHEEEARAVLLTDSADLVPAVVEAMERELATLSRADLIRAALERFGRFFVVRDLDDAAAVANAIAPEHMSVQTAAPEAAFEKVRNVGCAAIGGMTPVAAGDYYAGPNHILPTGRQARYASPLTAEDFRKVTSVIRYTPEGLRKACDDIRRIAEAEGFTAHARAVERRL
jgi:histidinol dehydrogenase